MPWRMGFGSMAEINSTRAQIRDLRRRGDLLREVLEYDRKCERLDEVRLELEDPNSWGDQEKARQLGKERAALERVVETMRGIQRVLDETDTLLLLAEEEQDREAVDSVCDDLGRCERKLAGLEFLRMFSGDMDANNAYLDVQSGSGGTEAQDWAEMLLRMYLRWGEQHDFKTALIQASPGEVAGIKGATVRYEGEYAFGWLRTEAGVHRLVRKSPFDSGNRRHTSFASVFVSPEIEDNVEIAINPAEVRTDTYRASGAGGQHVNKTDSAVRLTHVPTGVVVQCQNDRSQHKNREQAMKQLRARLYELEVERMDEKRRTLEESKADISWGSQIRSYVLDQSRIKDLRTGVETGNTQRVLDGDLDQFMEASLKAGF